MVFDSLKRIEENVNSPQKNHRLFIPSRELKISQNKLIFLFLLKNRSAKRIGIDFLQIEFPYARKRIESLKFSIPFCFILSFSGGRCPLRNCRFQFGKVSRVREVLEKKVKKRIEGTMNRGVEDSSLAVGFPSLNWSMQKLLVNVSQLAWRDQYSRPSSFSSAPSPPP